MKLAIVLEWRTLRRFMDENVSEWDIIVCCVSSTD